MQDKREGYIAAVWSNTYVEVAELLQMLRMLQKLQVWQVLQDSLTDRQATQLRHPDPPQADALRSAWEGIV